MKKILLSAGVLAVLYFIAPVHVQMGLKHVFADVDDYKIFDKNTLSKSTQPKPWPVSENYNKNAPSDELLQFFKDRQTCAFLVIKDGQIVYENYWEEYTKETISGSFSMAKTVNAILIGKLIEQGKVKVTDDIKKLVPQLTQVKEGELTLRDVLTMSANLDWSESYWNIFSLTAESYYGDDLDKLMGKLKVRKDKQQGKLWEYQSACTQILGYVIKNATGKSVAENAQQYLWEPLGAESDALWSTDKNGMEKSFCCLNATARDFARLGQMVLQHGKWDTLQLIDSTYIHDMTTAATGLKDKDGNTLDWYGYQTWIIHYEGHTIPYFRGILGQFIYVIPNENAVVVRLGKKIKKDSDDPKAEHRDIKNYIEAGLQVLGKSKPNS